jgi:transposase-like protein
MTKSRKVYTRQFKEEALELLQTSGRSANQLEQELGIGKGCLTRWKQELTAEGEQAFPGHGHLPPDQERLRRLERENEILRQERDILKKAIAIFSHPKP